MKRILVALLLLIFGCAASEAIARTIRPASFPTYPDVLASRPAAYDHADYWSPAFAAEQAAVMSLATVQEDGALTVQEFTGRWFNFRNGIRATTDQPAHAAHTIYLFGSSTTANIEAPDNLTIASHLQRLVGSEYRVINLGRGAQSTNRQLGVLQGTPLSAGDIVIWYDGYVDTVGIYNAARNRAGMTPCGYSAYQFALLTMACIQPMVIDNLDSEVASMTKRFTENAQQAKVYTESAGATFYHFLEPYMYSRPLSAYEQTILANPNLVPPGFDAIAAAGWDALSKVDGIINLTHAVDELRASGVEVYFDDHHANHLANEVVAQAIADALR
jgi:hypothetical protein